MASLLLAPVLAGAYYWYTSEGKTEGEIALERELQGHSTETTQAMRAVIAEVSSCWERDAELLEQTYAAFDAARIGQFGSLLERKYNLVQLRECHARMLRIQQGLFRLHNGKIHDLKEHLVRIEGAGQSQELVRCVQAIFAERYDGNLNQLEVRIRRIIQLRFERERELNEEQMGNALAKLSKSSKPGDVPVLMKALRKLERKGSHVKNAAKVAEQLRGFIMLGQECGSTGFDLGGVIRSKDIQLVPSLATQDYVEVCQALMEDFDNVDLQFAENANKTDFTFTFTLPNKNVIIFNKARWNKRQLTRSYAKATHLANYEQLQGSNRFYWNNNRVYRNTGGKLPNKKHRSLYTYSSDAYRLINFVERGMPSLALQLGGEGGVAMPGVDIIQDQAGKDVVTVRDPTKVSLTIKEAIVHNFMASARHKSMKAEHIPVHVMTLRGEGPRFMDTVVPSWKRAGADIVRVSSEHFTGHSLMSTSDHFVPGFGGGSVRAAGVFTGEGRVGIGSHSAIASENEFLLDSGVELRVALKTFDKQQGNKVCYYSGHSDYHHGPIDKYVTASNIQVQEYRKQTDTERQNHFSGIYKP